ncbi:SGNH/GDSL hydrolase family protein [Dinghuibacter silviterrae]|uniref:Lysophospholipase L1-like esterase n=1 Tax=Dinghuibacter silviterrae TaxID=1539049 RepID=A0A4R8DPW8_9BACT|nr:SGNH/GDSL hydrolase family protein [Dinghuibacter silviterrae]TDW99787.1 lysophospholipase L1-like esterase [Dinghuibacter silviterrae]
MTTKIGGISLLCLFMSLKMNVFAQQDLATKALLQQDWACLKCFADSNAKVPPPAPDENRVVFMGNSITIGWLNLDPGFFEGKPYLDRGVSGQTTSQMLIRFRPDVVDLKPKVVVILAGTNDIAGNTGYTSNETIVGNIVSMAELAKSNGIQVVISSILPAYDYPWRPGMDPLHRIPQVNALLKAYAESHGMTYLDYFSTMVDERGGLKQELTHDGVHPTKDGYLVMRPLAEKAIENALQMQTK